MIQDSVQYFVELNGLLIGGSSKRIEQVQNLPDKTGDKWLITDFGQAISRTMTVESDIKYVDLMVRRKLQEAGEFDEPITVIPHWKKKKKANTADIFFTAVPTRILDQYYNQINEHSDNLIVYPLYAVLYEILKYLRPKKPVAVIFSHGRFADWVVGSKQKIYASGRSVAYDTDQDQLCALWDTVKNQIQHAESEYGIEVKQAYRLNWIDCEPGLTFSDDENKQVIDFESHDIAFHEGIKKTSFLKALGKISASGSISPLSTKFLYYARRMVLWLNITLLVVALGMFGGYFYYRSQTDRIEKDNQYINKAIADMQLVTPVQSLDPDYETTLDMVKAMAAYQTRPSFKQVIMDMDQAISSDMQISVLKLKYNDKELKIEVFGRIMAPFNVAHQAYQSFIDHLARKKYLVLDRKFDTEIQESKFLLKMSKKTI